MHLICTGTVLSYRYRTTCSIIISGDGVCASDMYSNIISGDRICASDLIWALVKNFGSSDETRRNPRCFPYMYESLSMYELVILCSSELNII